ncbi:hypothetical protein, partial [Geodermatophilus sp. DF01-2]|uniref:hypothetical protein n=1 Tax=Geodermatophilus sp. DF01-2 TaxID=2559610 RepID=UPI001ADD7258
MANDRALAHRPSRVADDLTLSGLLDVLDRAEPLPPRGRPRPRRAAVHRSGAARRPVAVRPIPLPSSAHSRRRSPQRSSGPTSSRSAGSC